MGADSALVLDHYLQVKAKELGKSVVGVETVEEQIAAVEAALLASIGSVSGGGAATATL